MKPACPVRCRCPAFGSSHAMLCSGHLLCDWQRLVCSPQPECTSRSFTVSRAARVLWRALTVGVRPCANTGPGKPYTLYPIPALCEQGGLSHTLCAGLADLCGALVQAAVPVDDAAAAGAAADAAGRVRYWRVRQGVVQPVQEHALHQVSRTLRLFGCLCRQCFAK